jgi:HSP20 family protein
MIPIVRFNRPALADDFFRSALLGDIFNDEARFQSPAVNIAENDNDFNIEVAAPGFEKDDFKIHLDHNVLTISSEKETAPVENKPDFKRREFNYSSFKRSFSLPDVINSEKISAVYKNGILSIQIPKREEAKVKPAREIEIA